MCSESRGSIESTWHNPVGYLYLLFCTGSWGQPSPVKPTHHHAFVMRQRLSDDLKLEVTFVFRNRLVSSRCHIRKKMELDFSAFDYDMIILAYKIHRKNIANAPDVPAISVEFSAALASGSGDFLKWGIFHFLQLILEKKNPCFVLACAVNLLGFIESWIVGYLV